MLIKSVVRLVSTCYELQTDRLEKADLKMLQATLYFLRGGTLKKNELNSFIGLEFARQLITELSLAVSCMKLPAALKRLPHSDGERCADGGLSLMDHRHLKLAHKKPQFPLRKSLKCLLCNYRRACLTASEFISCLSRIIS
jgi:hypothetical protein